MKTVRNVLLSAGLLMALVETALGACPVEPFAPGGQAICPRPSPPPPPPPPPPEPNRLRGPDGNPVPGHNRCGDMQIPLEECDDAQNLAYFEDQCINTTEYNYSQAHSIAPLCSPITPTNYIGFCYCGCLARTTQLLVRDPRTGQSSTRQIDAIMVGSVQVHALTEDATLSSVRYEPRDLETTTAGPEAQPLVVVHLGRGVQLGLTEHHAVLLSTGQMVAAKDLHPGHVLVKQDGSPNEIERITRESTTDDVFNVLTNAGLSHKGHMIVANGVVVGDLMWQNTLAKDLQRVIVRR